MRCFYYDYFNVFLLFGLNGFNSNLISHTYNTTPIKLCVSFPQNSEYAGIWLMCGKLQATGI